MKKLLNVDQYILQVLDEDEQLGEDKSKKNWEDYFTKVDSRKTINNHFLDNIQLINQARCLNKSALSRNEPSSKTTTPQIYKTYDSTYRSSPKQSKLNLPPLIKKQSVQQTSSLSLLLKTGLKHIANTERTKSKSPQK